MTILGHAGRYILGLCHLWVCRACGVFINIAPLDFVFSGGYHISMATWAGLNTTSIGHRHSRWEGGGGGGTGGGGWPLEKH